jgi:hypothetical protein
VGVLLGGAVEGLTTLITMAPTTGRVLALLTAASFGALVGYTSKHTTTTTSSSSRDCIVRANDAGVNGFVLQDVTAGTDVRSPANPATQSPSQGASDRRPPSSSPSSSSSFGLSSSTVTSADDNSNTPAWTPPSDRATCAQAWLFRTFGYDHIPDFFVPGCDTPAVYDFEKWAAQSGCASETPPDELLVHTAWLGPLGGIHDELVALIDSFLATHATNGARRASITVWFMEGQPPDKSNPLRARYAQHDGVAVRFLKADLAGLAVGTCLEGKKDFLDVNVSGSNWKASNTMGPKEKADLVRLLLLHRYGGVWVDTDSVLLRDLRPLVAFAGPDFAAKVTLSPYYNNNVLGAAKGGMVARRLLEFVCATPYGNTAQYEGPPLFVNSDAFVNTTRLHALVPLDCSRYDSYQHWWCVRFERNAELLSVRTLLHQCMRCSHSRSCLQTLMAPGTAQPSAIRATPNGGGITE